MKYFVFFTSLVLLITLSQCNSGDNPVTAKISSNDPFQKTITSSQFFEIKGSNDTIIEGKDGTLITIPSGSIVDANGNPVKVSVQVELVEALSISDMVLSNLNTTSGGSILETDGMLYINITSNGKQLYINDQQPIYIEVPTKNKLSNMMVYEGTRDEQGNMNWKNPKELEKFLIPIQMDLLDFLPKGFEAEVERNLPFRNHNQLNDDLVDSLYFHLTTQSAAALLVGLNPEAVDINEAFYNKHWEVVDGKYTKSSFDRKDSSYRYYDKNMQQDVEVDTTVFSGADSVSCNVIEPSKIKVISSVDYENTLIATREFETRLQAIFKTCRADVLDLYVKNLDKNLWEIDSMAMLLFASNENRNVFKSFYKEKLTKVKNAGRYAAVLKGYYEKRLKVIEAQIKMVQDQAAEELKRKNELAETVKEKYKTLLFQREKFRMEKYSFEWTSTGWLNIDRGPETKEIYWRPLEVTIKKGEKYDRVYTYLVFLDMKSMYRLNSEDNVHFYVGNETKREMIMPRTGKALLVSIGYSGDNMYYRDKKIETNRVEEKSFGLRKSSLKKIRKELAEYDNYGAENKIGVDLSYMNFFVKEQERAKKLEKEAEFIQKLIDIAFPCCGRELNGQVLYSIHCAPCHKIGLKAIGPALGSSIKKHKRDWLVRFTKNNDMLRASGDMAAIQSFKEYNGSVMPVFENLTEKQIHAIFDYIEQSGSKNF